MAVRTILIIPEAHAEKFSIVAGQMNYPQDFTQSRKLCAYETEATSSTPPTHYLANDAAMSTEMEQKFRLMAAGEFMPQVVWADVPGITETTANAAAQALAVISEAGGDTLGDLPLILQARGLKFVPDPEL